MIICNIQSCTKLQVKNCVASIEDNHIRSQTLYNSNYFVASYVLTEDTNTFPVISQTYNFPVLSTAIPRGWSSSRCPVVLNLPRKSPLVVKTTTQFFSRSVTYMMPFESIQMPWGRAKWPPMLHSYLPVAANLTTLCFAKSVTYTAPELVDSNVTRLLEVFVEWLNFL